MRFVLTALGSGTAVAVELLEAMAIVLAVGTTRRWRDALLGAAGGVLACVVLAVMVGPVLLDRIGQRPLRLIIGAALLWFGVNWLRKAVLRLSGRKRRSSNVREFEETREEAAELAPAPADGADWAARAIAFKGVLLEGVEVVLIVSALAAKHANRTPALLGAAVAAVLTLGAGAALRHPLARIPETELKAGVGLVLTTFGVFFVGEGAGVDWPGGDLSLLALLAVIALVCATAVAALRPPRRPAPG